MTLLILGSNGFIGAHLAAAETATGEIHTADVTASDGPNHTVIGQTDGELRDLIARVRPDVCVNCAGAASVPLSFESPARDFRLNVGFVHDILEAFRMESPSTKFVHLSSAAVYGNAAASPIGEDAPVSPISPYGWHKLAAEGLCREYSECFGIPTLSLRLFSVFGPGLRKQIYWDIYQKSRGVDRITCPGTGEEARDYVYVADVVAAILIVIERARFDGGVINVANGRSVSIGEAIHALLDAVGWDGTVEFDGKRRSGDPVWWRANIERLAALGFVPSHDHGDGIRKLAAWLKASQ